jgi:phage terminase small subunit
MGHGPAMQALTEKQRKFVLALFDAPKMHRAGTFAVRSAGYGNEHTKPNTLHVIASQLRSDPKVQAAIAEVSTQYLVTLGPHAVHATKKLLADPKHRDHGRAIGIVMDRVVPILSTAVVKVEGEVKLSTAETAQIMNRIEQLAAKFAVALPAPKVIEHKAVA